MRPRPQLSEGEVDSPLWKRLGWMAAIWGMSVAALGVVAFLIRWWLMP